MGVCACLWVFMRVYGGLYEFMEYTQLLVILKFGYFNA